MKNDIHPQLNPVVFLDTSSGEEFLASSTLTSDQKKKVNGVDHYVIKVEISSKSHPFYTGKRKLVDTAGRVDKFLARAKKAQQIQEKKVKLVDEELDEILHETPKAEDDKASQDQPEDTAEKPKKAKKTAAKKTKKAAPKKTKKAA